MMILRTIAARLPAVRLGVCWLALVWLLPLPAAWSLEDPELAFRWQEANELLAAADSPDDYRRAAQAYQQIVAGGVQDGHLFYNLGTALLQAGSYDEAIDALTRAERHLGSRPEILHNISIAIARKQRTPDVEWQWHRRLLFWHYWLPWRVRALAAAAAFSLCWLALALRRLGVRRGMRGLATLCFLASVVLAVSAAVTWRQETAARRPAVAPPVPAGPSAR